ncbi:hypothetical protein O6H91_11G081400 [Diphasiastrum complanatum]|uniref:Uncharacterized protein n=1 Tax=Diphasiastrum complanatum TaxID=34168 RepID=A0ACC2CB08_DIPCM|nr:hypothetical protein O6H91_11G081400 [Diphasiastrum complanatum]
MKANLTIPRNMLARFGILIQRRRCSGHLEGLTRAVNSSIWSRFSTHVAVEAKDETSILSEVKRPAHSVRPLSLDTSSPLRFVDPPPVGFKGITLKLFGFYSRQSKLIRGSRFLYTRVTAQVEDPHCYASLDLEQNFRTTHALLVLHLWLCLVRLRAEGKEGVEAGQYLYEVFNHDVEQRVVKAGVKMLVSKWMKELEKNFYGAVSAYDAAMKPNASKDELAQALWRNVFAEDDSLLPSGPPAAPVHALARYVRRETACLSVTDINSILSGNIMFTRDFADL